MAHLRRAAAALLTLAAPGPAGAQDAPSPIRVNQVGYHPAAPKIAVVADSEATTFAVLGAERGDTVLRGTLSPPRRWGPSDEVVRQADLTPVTRPGRYVLAVAGVGAAPFVVDAARLRELARATIKAFYFQRASVPLDARHAGPWARAAGHPDTAVRVHPSAAGPGRPAGTVISAPGGWYDAGDYNEYVVNSGISTYTLLLVAEQLPAYAAALRTDVPESGNALPDVLDEALVNLRWMRRMQDPADGGVYHKLTTAEFDRFEPPERDTATRWVVQKSTAAALDFAATAAHASLVTRRYARALPGLADSLARDAQAAWRWARAHPDSLYDQRRLANPRVNTGAYGDRALGDEVRWAAAELWLATGGGRAEYLAAAEPLAPPPADVPSWGSVRTLGLYSLVDHALVARDRRLPGAGALRAGDGAALRARLLALADTLVARARASAYGVPLVERDFVWGSNAVAANQGVALLQAWRLAGDTAYLHAAAGVLDYLLGRNATGYSFVTGYGVLTPKAPHHRPSASDTVAAPVPGLLVGGPNPGRQDGCAGYPSRLPARSYLDDVCSYASNEVAINWNAPLAYLAAALDAAFDAAFDAAPAAARPARRR